MSILGIGSDIIEVPRIERAVKKSDAFLSRVYTQTEIAYAMSDIHIYEHLAGRFAAKEAVAKAFGRSFSWKDVEIVNDENGKPIALLHNMPKKLIGNGKIHITISHTNNCAIAMAVLEDC